MLVFQARKSNDYQIIISHFPDRSLENNFLPIPEGLNVYRTIAIAQPTTPDGVE